MFDLISIQRVETSGKFFRFENLPGAHEYKSASIYDSQLDLIQIGQTNSQVEPPRKKPSSYSTLTLANEN